MNGGMPNELILILQTYETSIEMGIGSIPFDMDHSSIFQDVGLEEKISYKTVIFKWVNEEWVKEVL